MSSLLLLNISYVLANFLVLSDTLLFEYFPLQGKKLDFAKTFNKSRHNDVKLGHCANQVMTRSWKWWAMMSNVGGCITSGFEVIVRGPEALPKRSQEDPESPVCYVKKASIEF